MVRQENPKIVISSVIAQAVNTPRFLAMTTVLNLEHSEGFHDLFRSLWYIDFESGENAGFSLDGCII